MDFLRSKIGPRLAPAALGLLLIALPFEAQANDLPPAGPVAALEQALIQLYQQKAAAVVRVKVATTESRANEGEKVSLTVFSGFFISDTGLVVTNALPQTNVSRAWIEHQNQSYIATLIGSDERSNIGLLRLAAPPPGITFVDLAHPNERAPLASLAFGVTSPLDFAPSPSWGIVTGHESGFGDFSFPFTYTRVSIPVGPAEGGSPVFDLQGRLIGISVAALPEVNSGYLVPARALAKIVKDLETLGNVRHGEIHVEFELKAANLGASKQVVVKSVAPRSQAAQQNIRPGDVLLKIDELQINSVEQARDLLFFSQPGNFVQLTVQRDGKPLDFGLMLDAPSPTPKE